MTWVGRLVRYTSETSRQMTLRSHRSRCPRRQQPNPQSKWPQGALSQQLRPFLSRTKSWVEQCTSERVRPSFRRECRSPSVKAIDQWPYPQTRAFGRSLGVYLCSWCQQQMLLFNSCSTVKLYFSGGRSKRRTPPSWVRPSSEERLDKFVSMCFFF